MTAYTLWQRFKMWIDWPAYVGHRTFPGWTGHLPFYAFKCRWHGIVENYPQGHKHRLYCPVCQEEDSQSSFSKVKKVK